RNPFSNWKVLIALSAGTAGSRLISSESGFSSLAGLFCPTARDDQMAMVARMSRRPQPPSAGRSANTRDARAEERFSDEVIEAKSWEGAWGVRGLAPSSRIESIALPGGRLPTGALPAGR